jgi:pyruvate dehydrogenase E2 component (dihydrolipoamide acetyltransferase)
MAAEVVMPALGLAQETGRLLRWLRAEGEAVAQGEPLMEIETDKAVVVVEAPAGGTLAAVRAAEGDEVPVGQVIAVILEPGERPQAAAPAPAKGGAPGPRAAGAAAPPPPHAGPAAVGPPPAPARVAASPKARRLARERGVDLARLAAGLAGGPVLAADVEAALAAGSATGPGPGEGETLALTAAERLMAELTLRSWTGAPHFHLAREVDAARLAAWRGRAEQRLGLRVTYTDLLLRLVAAALREHPRLNASWRDGAVALRREVNLGLAVATEQGLVVPVIHHADRLGLREIAQRRAEAVARAQAGRLTPEDVAGGTFTVSNLGMLGVDAFQAVIGRDQCALLAVGRIAPRVLAVGGRPAVRPTAILTLACDHRVVDGARAARFLATLADLVEEPLGLLP